MVLKFITIEVMVGAYFMEKFFQTNWIFLSVMLYFLQGISHVIKCACGEEYKVEVDCCV